jgi:hypothetical protein
LLLDNQILIQVGDPLEHHTFSIAALQCGDRPLPSRAAPLRAPPGNPGERQRPCAASPWPTGELLATGRRDLPAAQAGPPARHRADRSRRSPWPSQYGGRKFGPGRHPSGQPRCYKCPIRHHQIRQDAAPFAPALRVRCPALWPEHGLALTSQRALSWSFDDRG